MPNILNQEGIGFERGMNKHWGDFMKDFQKWRVLAVAASLVVMPSIALAQADAPPVAAESGGVATSANQAAGSDPAGPLRKGGYVSLMGTYQMTQDDPILDHAFGGVGLLGYREGWYALETGFAHSDDSSIERQSFKLRALIFPFDSLPFLYGIVGGGITRYVGYPALSDPPGIYIDGRQSATTADLATGLGYMIPLKAGNYEYALRAEVVFELGDRFLERQTDFDTDINTPSTYKDVVFGLGLQLPTRSQPPPPPPPEPVVVPVDTDGDGVTDDLDQCPGTPAGTKVDAKGCPLPPPCKTPEAGEKVSLAGCGTGDVVVLRGVNFEFDKSRLTPDATSILDGVAEELIANPGISVELGGHTDAKGSDEYNQTLSEARAASVVEYLTAHGVDGSRMTSVGYGEAQPVSDNDTDEGRELNRRVELKVTANTGAATVVSETAGAPATETAPAAEPAAATGTEAAPVEGAAAPVESSAPPEATPAAAPEEGAAVPAN